MIIRLPTLAPFQHSIFRSVWIASLASNFGTLIQTVGAAWMMTLISNSANMVALVQASTALPIMLFSVVSGAIADNFNRRKVMLAAQGFMLCVSVTLTLAAYFGFVTPWLLLAFTFLLGCGTALHNPSWQASVGDMVPRQDLPAAVALNSMSFNLTRSVGPAVGGAIVAAAGAAAAFAVNAASYLALIGVLLRWKVPVSKSKLPRETLGLAIGAGLRYIAMSPNIEKVFLRAFVFGFSSISILALLPLVARHMHNGDALLYGILFGAFGVGAVGGALVSTFLRHMLSNEWTVRSAFLGFAFSAATIAAGAPIWLTCVALLAGGAAWVVALSLFNVTVQLSTPRWVVGRALSLYQTAAFGGMAIGSWTWGLAADGYGPERALQMSAFVMLAGALMGFGRLAMPAQESLNLDPLNRWKEPQPELDLMPRSGPIKIMIEYVIKERDTRRFLNIMAERRRVRRRDGARRWTLTRDIEHPRQWIESYQFPTWVEYVRYNERTTQEDAPVADRIRRLHAGAEPPRVRRLIERPTGRRYLIEPQPKGMIDIHH